MTDLNMDAACIHGQVWYECARCTDSSPHDSLASWAWTIIANVSGGDWTQQTHEWRHAATAWRDAYHEAIDAHRTAP